MKGNQRVNRTTESGGLRPLRTLPGTLPALLLALFLGGSRGVLALPSEPADRSIAAIDLQELSRDLSQLRDAEFAERADELWEGAPELTLHVMFLRAGREIPTTVSATRREEREDVREAAIAWIRGRLATDPEGRPLWDRTLREVLSADTDPILWCAAARTVGRMHAHEYSPQLAAGLESEVPEIVQAARLALFDIFLRWFEDRAAFETIADGETRCPGDIFEAPAVEFERLAREREVQLLAYEPQKAPALLVAADPRLRAAAAQTLGRAGNGKAAIAIETLLDHLEHEVNGEAYQAVLDALLKTLGAEAPDDERVRRLRLLLEKPLGLGPAELQAPLAHALSRVPWSDSAEGSDSVLIGVRLLVAQFEALAAPERLTDRDALIASMRALLSVAGHATRAGLSVAPRLNRLGELTITLIENEREYGGVRVAAAQLLPLVGGPHNLERAAAVLEAELTPTELRYTLLAAVGDMTRVLSPDDPAAIFALSTLLGRLQGDDVDLRRRALSYLTDESLAPLVQRADPAAFVQSLGRETASDVQAQLLDMIATLGGGEQVDLLLDLPNFDAIADGGPAIISRLVQTLTGLAKSDTDRLVRSAVRLLAVDNEGTRVLRLREALKMVAALDEGAAANLGAERDHAIVLWADELRRAAGSVPGGKEFLARLVTVHLPNCLESAERRTPDLAHARALFLSDWIAADPSAGQADQVLAHFAEALELAIEVDDGEIRALVLRDRARFHLSREDQALALADYRTLFATEIPTTFIQPTEAATPGLDSVLELGDLRRGAELLVGADPGQETAALALEATRVYFALVSRPTWKREPAAVRVQDLRDLAERALAAGDLESLAAVALQLEALPALPPEPVEGQDAAATPATPEGVLWSGLLETREDHAALLELDDRLKGRIRALQTPSEPPAAPPANGEEESDSPAEESPPPPVDDGSAPKN